MSTAAIDLHVQIRGEAEIPILEEASGTLAEIKFSRVIAEIKNDSGTLPEMVVADVVTFEVGSDLAGEIDIQGVAKDSTVSFSLLRSSGLPAFTKSATASAAKIEFEIDHDDLKILVEPTPQPAESAAPAVRRAQLIPNGTAVPFERCGLQVAPVATGDGGWTTSGLVTLIGSDLPVRAAVAVPPGTAIPPLNWRPVHLEVDGRFTATMRSDAGESWAWWLTGACEALGFVPDALGTPSRDLMSVLLPPIAAAVPATDDCATCGRTAPAAATEEELADNPLIYSEDPGAYCKPFSNPERVLGERAFNVITRVEQPAISVGPSIKVHGPVVFDFDNAVMAPARSLARVSNAGAAANIEGLRNAELLSAASDATTIRETHLPSDYLDILDRVPRGRAELNANNPIQWEGDSSRYQASTVTRGHIIEYRVRWRSNGYSLGTVASTLTLAPRQVKRIQKVEWQRAEQARRDEDTGFTERVADEVARDRTYDDQVESSLSEWASGRSNSSATAGAVGVGFAAAGFVIGGGGVHSTASSSSSQEGGRRVAASEEQRLRDSIKRFADARRRFESTVVSEISQEESVTGTVEVIRNPNYAHSLTVIYHQILRHMRVDTEVAGVRECLFVPFAMRPFTLDRAYRWRDTISQYLKKPQLAVAFAHIKDVLSGFAASDIPPGRRSDLPVRYLHGSIFLKLGIERPADSDDGGFIEVNWGTLAPYLSTPPRGIFARLRDIIEHQRDQVFQEQFAPAAAAKWVDRLELAADGATLAADFTLATRYQFNGTVRVDFTASIPDGQVISRETLRKITVRASKPLPKGSSAAVTRLSFSYQTDNFERSVSMNAGVADLIDPETGDPDAGAELQSIPTSWERQDLRAEITRSVNELVDHLNEHVEYYNKASLWATDRDRLLIMLDGFFVPRTNGVSIASVVEREPIAIVGNCLVYRVAAGSFLGLDGITSPQQLVNYYIEHQPPRSPMLVSMPTDGLYAQTIMDECGALEEHFGNTDWVLNQAEPTLGDLPPELLQSRNTPSVVASPTPLPTTIINLQNAPDAPDPAGLSGVLGAVTNANSFRDMAGLAGTQANAQAAMQAAASLATNFGNQAAALKLADIASKAQATQSADQQLATIKKAKDLGLVTEDQAAAQANEVLKGLHTATASAAPHENPAVAQAIKTAGQTAGSVIEASTQDGQVRVEMGKGSDVGAAAEEPAATDDDAEDKLVSGPYWFDSHGSEMGSDSNFAVDDSSLLAFNEPEHASLGESVQWMIDKWAMKGLIDGGAMIDTHARDTPSKLSARIQDWDVFAPDAAQPTDPYHVATSYAHWHYITPDPLYSNASSKTRWTSATLKTALQQGKATALSIGQMVMLSGDYLGSFDELASPQTQPRWTNGTAANAMAGFDAKDPLAYLLLDAKTFPPKGTLSDEKATLDSLERAKSNRADVMQEIANGDFKRLEALVKFMRQVRGTTPFTELHMLGHTMNTPGASKALVITFFKNRVPWLPANAADQLQAAIAPGEFNKLLTDGFPELFYEMTMSNGYFGELGFHNDAHFAPGNWQRFSDEHRQALEAVQTQLSGAAPQGSTAAIPAIAIARTAFSAHFLTDAFSASHMRVPRAKLGVHGSLAAKVMHDLDGLYGLIVQNGFAEKWRAFGDGYLDPGETPANPTQKKILDQMAKANAVTTGIDISARTNKKNAVAAIGAAFKQLHYEAQRHKADATAAPFKPVLDAATLANGLVGDDLAPSSPGDGNFANWLTLDINDKIAFMQKHQPLPVGVGSTVLENHPPLYDANAKVATAGYTWNKHKTSLNLDRVLHLRWHGNHIAHDFSDVYHFGLITEGVVGWLAGGETEVQKLPIQLKEE
jgi:hypothetical protein